MILIIRDLEISTIIIHDLWKKYLYLESRIISTNTVYIIIVYIIYSLPSPPFLLMHVCSLLRFSNFSHSTCAWIDQVKNMDPINTDNYIYYTTDHLPPMLLPYRVTKHNCGLLWEHKGTLRLLEAHSGFLQQLSTSACRFYADVLIFSLFAYIYTRMSSK